MILYKKIEIDMEKYRDRVNSSYKNDKGKIVPLYPKKVREALLNLYDIFESGDFKKASEIFQDWDRKKDNKIEYVDEQIYFILMHLLHNKESKYFFSIG